MHAHILPYICVCVCAHVCIHGDAHAPPDRFSPHARGPPTTTTSVNPSQSPHTKSNHNNNRDQTESPTALRAEFARRLFLTEEQQLQVRAFLCMFFFVCVAWRSCGCYAGLVCHTHPYGNAPGSLRPSHKLTNKQTNERTSTGGADDRARDGGERHPDGRGGGADGRQGTYTYSYYNCSVAQAAVLYDDLSFDVFRRVRLSHPTALYTKPYHHPAVVVVPYNKQELERVILDYEQKLEKEAVKVRNLLS